MLALLILSVAGFSPDLGFTYVLSLRGNGNIKDSKTFGTREKNEDRIDERAKEIPHGSELFPTAQLEKKKIELA